MPSRVDGLDQREQLLDQQRREAERRLVEDQELRLGHQAAPDRQHLLLAAGQRAGALAPAARQAAGRSRTRGSRLCRAARAAAAIGAEIEVFAHRHVGEDAPALRHMDQAARDDRRRALALDRRVRRSGCCRCHGRITPEIVRLSVDLPAPLAPSTATISPGRTVEIDAAQDFGRAVAGVQAADREERLRHARLPPSSAPAAPWPR